MSKLDILKKLGDKAMENFENFLKITNNEETALIQTIITEYEKLLQKISAFNKKHKIDNSSIEKVMKELAKDKKDIS